MGSKASIVTMIQATWGQVISDVIAVQELFDGDPSLRGVARRGFFQHERGSATAMAFLLGTAPEALRGLFLQELRALLGPDGRCSLAAKLATDGGQDLDVSLPGATPKTISNVGCWVLSGQILLRTLATDHPHCVVRLFTHDHLSLGGGSKILAAWIQSTAYRTPEERRIWSDAFMSYAAHAQYRPVIADLFSAQRLMHLLLGPLAQTVPPHAQTPALKRRKA